MATHTGECEALRRRAIHLPLVTAASILLWISVCWAGLDGGQGWTGTAVVALTHARIRISVAVLYIVEIDIAELARQTRIVEESEVGIRRQWLVVAVLEVCNVKASAIGIVFQEGIDVVLARVGAEWSPAGVFDVAEFDVAIHARAGGEGLRGYRRGGSLGTGHRRNWSADRRQAHNIEQASCCTDRRGRSLRNDLGTERQIEQREELIRISLR